MHNSKHTTKTADILLPILMFESQTFYFEGTDQHVDIDVRNLLMKHYKWLKDESSMDSIDIEMAPVKLAVGKEISAQLVLTYGHIGSIGE